MCDTCGCGVSTNSDATEVNSVCEVCGEDPCVCPSEGTTETPEEVKPSANDPDFEFETDGLSDGMDDEDDLDSDEDDEEDLV